MITHEAAVKTGARDYVLGLINNEGPGDIQLLTAASAVLATQALEATAFVAGELDGVPRELTGADEGDIAKYRFRDGEGTVIMTGTAGRSNAITAVSQGARTLGVAADLSAVLDPGDLIRVTDSAGNDGTYTVVSASYDDPTTTITVVEALPDDTVDGTLHPHSLTVNNVSLAVGQKVNITSHAYEALRQ